MKRLILLALAPALMAAAPVVQQRSARSLWVKYDAEARKAVLSNGSALTNSITPGQLVSYGRQGELRASRQWRPPQDIIKEYAPASGMTRVNFSHERHFASLGVKDCKSCHAAEKGLGLGQPFASLAKEPATEPHGEKSVGRFCANCHRSELKTSEIAGAKPPQDVAMFTAMGHKGDTSCGSCHVPADHGEDFTRGHGKRAKGNRAQCATCHIGATAISAAELTQARNFQQAQLKLIGNPDDKDAFRQTLPNVFCAYCHTPDQKPWRGEGRQRAEH